MIDIIEKIKKIEALINGASTEGEKNAAISAKNRILDKHNNLDIHLNPSEYTLYTSGEWHKKLLLAICRKYGVKPYRYKRQKYTTVMVNMNGDFLEKIIWKEYLQYVEHLEDLVKGVTDDLINKIHKHEDEDLVHGNLT